MSINFFLIHLQTIIVGERISNQKISYCYRMFVLYCHFDKKYFTGSPNLKKKKLKKKSCSVSIQNWSISVKIIYIMCLSLLEALLPFFLSDHVHPTFVLSAKSVIRMQGSFLPTVYMLVWPTSVTNVVGGHTDPHPRKREMRKRGKG